MKAALLCGALLAQGAFAAPVQWGDLRDGSLYLLPARADELRIQWRPAGEQHEEAAGQRIDICSRIDVLPAQCFGRGVGDGRHDRTIGGQVRGIVECTSNSEVRQEDPFVIAGILWIGQQEIGGLDVAVHDAAAVCVVESLGNFGDDAGRPRG